VHWQTLITSLLVLACASYASWSVMPAAWRHRFAAWAGRPLTVANGCGGGCAGCEATKTTKSAGAQNKAHNEARTSVIRIVRRPPLG